MSNEQTTIYLHDQEELIKRKWSVLSIVGFSVSIVAFVIELIPWIYAATSLQDLVNLGEAGVPIFIIWILAFTFIFGISWIIGGMIGIASLIMSIVGLIRIAKQDRRGKAFAIIGIVLSVISICQLLLISLI